MGNQPKEPKTIIETPKSRSSLTTAGYGASNRERSQSSSKTASNAQTRELLSMPDHQRRQLLLEATNNPRSLRLQKQGQLLKRRIVPILP